MKNKIALLILSLIFFLFLIFEKYYWNILSNYSVTEVIFNVRLPLRIEFGILFFILFLINMIKIFREPFISFLLKGTSLIITIISMINLMGHLLFFLSGFSGLPG